MKTSRLGGRGLSACSFVKNIDAQFVCVGTSRKEKKNIDTMHRLYVFASGGGGGEGVEEKRLVFVSK